MLIPIIIQSLSRTSTRLANRHDTISSLGCRLQLCQPSSTFTQANHHRKITAIDPAIINCIAPSGTLQAQSFQNVIPNRHLETCIRPTHGSLCNINKISLRLPGLNKPHDFINLVPFNYLGHLPLEKNLPPIIHQEKLEPNPGVEIREPSSIRTNLEKFAARLIQIRKKKMKKHKLRKLRKRMFFEWEKIKQRRAARREKHFVDCQLARIKNAEDFIAEEWVNEYLRKATTDPDTLIVKKPIPPRPTKYVF